MIKSLLPHDWLYYLKLTARMANWNVLSPEFAGFLIVLMLYMQQRKKSSFSINIVNGLITYIPPLDSDYD